MPSDDDSEGDGGGEIPLLELITLIPKPRIGAPRNSQQRALQQRLDANSIHEE